MLFCFLLVGSACGGSGSSVTEALEEQIGELEAEVDQEAEEVEEVEVEDRPVSLKDHYVSLEYNKPQDAFAQEIVTSSDVASSVIDEWYEVQENLNSIIGSYNRYIMTITTTDEYSQEVFDRLAEVGWEQELKIVDGYLVGAGCLTGVGDWLEIPDPYALRLMDYEFIQWPHETKEWGSPLPYRQAVIYHGWAHEYFHRYQRAHTLDRALGTSRDGWSQRNPVESPAWYVEGAAIIFPDLWLRHYLSELSAFAGLSFDDVNVEGMDLDRTFRQTKREMNGLEEQSNCDAFTADEEIRETSRCNWGIFNAYIAHLSSYQTLWVDIMEDINTMGFDASFEKHVGMTKEDAYRRYNEFMKTGPVDAPPPQGFFPEGPITGYVDFLNIDSGH